MGQSSSSESQTYSQAASPPAYKKVEIQPPNFDAAIGMALGWMQFALNGQGPAEYFVPVKKMDREDVAKLLDWFRDEEWSDRLKIHMDEEMVKKLGIQVQRVGNRKKEWAVYGAKAGAVVGVAVTATIAVACGVIPVFGWLVGGGLMICGLLGGAAVGAAAGYVAGAIVDHIRPTQIKLTLTQEGIHFAEERAVPKA